jgi:hypothetical protein
MPHIPHDSVLRSMIDIMQGYSNLYHTQTGSQMTRVHSHFFHDILAQLLTYPGEIIH